MFQGKKRTSQKSKKTKKEGSKKTPLKIIRCFIALVFVFTTYWLLNYCAFPLFDEVSLWTREISAASGGISLIAIALVALWRPDLLRKSFFMGILSCLALGFISMFAGLFFSSAAPLFIGAGLMTIGISLASVLVGLSCMSLDIRSIGISIALAYALSYILRFLFTSLPTEINLLFFVLTPFGTIALCTSYVRPILKKIFTSESPAQTAVTSPESLLPFVHQVFITLVVFRLIYGYTLTFAELDRIPTLPLLAVIPLSLYGIYLALRKAGLNPDTLFRISILFSIAGFLIPSAAGAQSSMIASNLLSSGTGFFEILMYFVLISLAAKNNTNALVVLTWGNAMASLGTIAGANLGRLVNHYTAVDHSAIAIISACIVFGLVAYILFIQRNFSFSETISKIEAATSVHSGERTPDFDQRCIALSEKATLTARESEIFMLLAQGRNARFIQDKLVVSYNTVKTHVSHIYSKLGVHTHQELIDLVEGTRSTDTA